MQVGGDRYWKPRGDRDESQDFLAHPQVQNNNRSQLPIWHYRKELLYAVENFRVVVLVGETGTGKSTQIPQILRRYGWTSNDKRILCTQPRRIAAISLAARVAEEMKCSVGGVEVGYHVRFDSKFSPGTQIMYVTDGILLRETLSDPILLKYNVIVVDDAHERSLNSDILLGLLKKVLRKRPNLRVIVTSATLQAQVIKDFFEDIGIKVGSGNTPAGSGDTSDTACILSIQGRQYPVDILYCESPVYNYIESAVETAIRIHTTETNQGDILVFLPGSEDCDACVQLLEERYEHADLVALPLYSSLPYHLQALVVANVGDSGTGTPRGYIGPRSSSSITKGIRKVIFATNIAESSITIPGVVFVIDTGFVKLKYFDINSGIESLVCCPSSRAAATQRAGRAGRTEPGKCFRLLTEEVFWASPTPPPTSSAAYSTFLASVVPDVSPAEMQRVDISTVVLQLKAIGVDNILHFDFISPPSPQQMIYSLELLHSLGAIDVDTGELTLCGRNMAEIGLEPKLSKCLLTSHFSYGCTSEILDILAMTSVNYPFLQLHHSRSATSKQEIEDNVSSFVSLEGDHLTLLNVFREFSSVQDSGQHVSSASSNRSRQWCQDHSVQFNVMQRAVEIRKQLRSLLVGIIKRNCLEAGRDAARCSGIDGSLVGDDIYRQNLPLDSSCGGDTVVVRKCLLSGYFGSIGKLTNSGVYCSLRGAVTEGAVLGGGLMRASGGAAVPLVPHPQSVFANYGSPPEWVLYNDCTYSSGKSSVYTYNRSSGGGSSSSGSDSSLTGCAYMRDMTKIDPKWIAELAQHYYTYRI